MKCLRQYPLARAGCWHFSTRQGSPAGAAGSADAFAVAGLAAAAGLAALGALAGFAVAALGAAAVLVNPENVFEIMRALHRVLVDQSLRDRLKQRGYEQAARFSWETSARSLLDVYRQLGGKNSKNEPDVESEEPLATAGAGSKQTS